MHWNFMISLIILITCNHVLAADQTLSEGSLQDEAKPSTDTESRSEIINEKMDTAEHAQTEAIDNIKTVQTGVSRSSADVAEQQIQYLDGFASGNSWERIGRCNAEKKQITAGCKYEFTVTNMCTFKEVVHGLFKYLAKDKEKMKKILSGFYTRQLVKENDPYSVLPDSMFTFDKCNAAKKTVKFSITSQEEIKPVGWLTMSDVNLEITLLYGELSKNINEDWFIARISGTGSLSLPSGGKQVTISKNVGLKPNGKEFGDEDVKITMSKQPSTFQLSEFLSLLDIPFSSLYPDSFDHTKLDLQKIAVEPKNNKNLLDIHLTGDGIWHAYLRGEPTGSSFFQEATKFIVYCKNGEVDDNKKVVCAVLSNFAKGGFKWQLTTNVISQKDNSVGQVREGMLHEVINAPELYFRMSRDGFEIPVEEVMKEFENFVLVKGKNGSPLFNEDYATSEACVVVRVDNFQEKYPGGNLYNPFPSLLIHACPYNDRIDIHLPFRYPTDGAKPGIFKYRSLPLLSAGWRAHTAFHIPQNHDVLINGFSVKRKIGGELEFCDSFSFYPLFVLLKQPVFSVMKNTTFTECKEESSNSQWKLSGSGEEHFLKAVAKVTAVSENTNRNGVIGPINIFDSRVIQDRAGASYLSGLPYVQAFGNLVSFPISNLRVAKYFEKNRQLFFYGKAKILNELDLQIIQYIHQSKPKLALCLRGSGSLGDFLGYIYNSDEMRQDGWKDFGSFSLISRTSAKEKVLFNKRDCKFVESEYKTKYRGSPKDYNQGVIMMAENLDLRSCEKTGQTTSICQFYKQSFGDTLRVQYYGQAYPSDDPTNHPTNCYYFIEGLSKQNMILGPGLEIQPLKYKPYADIFEELGEKRNFDSEPEQKKINIIQQIASKKIRSDPNMYKVVLDDYLYMHRNNHIVHWSAASLKEETEGGKIVKNLRKTDYIRGNLFIKSAAASIPAKIHINGEKVLLDIPEYDTNGLDLLGIPHVKTDSNNGVKADRYALNIEEPINRIEFNSRLRIGSVPGKEIVMRGNPELTTQYVYGANKNLNKFYACQQGGSKSQKLKLKRFYEAFGASFNKQAFKSLKVKGACFTYHNRDKPWYIQEKDLTVEKGLRLTGQIETKDGKSLQLTATFEEGTVDVTVNLPPMKWGVDYREGEKLWSNGTVEKVQLEKVRMEMVLGKDVADTLGPKYSIKYDGNTFYGGFIRGYMTTIGYAGRADIVISDDPSNPSGVLYNFQHNGRLFDRINGVVTLSATHSGNDLTKIDFTVSVNVYDDVKSLISRKAAAAVDTYTSSYQTGISNLNSALNKYTDLESKFNQFLQKFKVKSSEANQAMRRSKIERARTIAAVNKRCSHECNAVNMPGLKWQEQCMKTANGHIAGCMEFVKNRDIVSDVGCLSKCESERVRSHIEAIKRDSIARSNIADYEYAAECEDVATSLHDSIVKSELSKLKTLKTEIVGEKGRFARELMKASKARTSNFVVLNQLESEVKLTDIKQPKCLLFTVGFTINTESGSNLLTPYDYEICFNGKVVENLVESALEKGYGAEMSTLKESLDAAEASIAALDFEYENNIKKMEVPVQQCLDNKPVQPVDDVPIKRNFVPNTQLSPLYSSQFHVFSDHTIKLFHKYSPWKSIQRNDPFVEMKMHSVSKSEVPSEKNQDACSATRRSVKDFQDIVEYIKKWAVAHKDGEKKLSNLRNAITKQLEEAKADIGTMASSGEAAATNMDLANMHHWINVTDEGMKRWLVISTQNLQRLNREGIRLMKEQLKSAFSGNDHESLGAYFADMAKQANKSFKKANIVTKDETIFANLSKDLLNLLKDKMNLDEMLPKLETIERKVGAAEKRSISCVL